MTEFIDKRATKVWIGEHYISRDCEHIAREWAPGYTRIFTFEPARGGDGLPSMTDRHFKSLEAAREFARKKYPNAKQLLVSGLRPK